ncbi:MAG: GNAT family N-acetyltransferase [Candidatus Babeliales bacterium]|nr:GNAT family N-acetyltransferase [Candidatus Babeliales bacterium]
MPYKFFLICLVLNVYCNNIQEFMIDEAKKTDVQELIILLQELGYNFTEQEIQEKITTYATTKHNKLFTNRLNGKICGFLAFDFSDSFIKGPSGKIDTLIVKQEYRSLGIGKQLVSHAENYAKQLGCTLISVTSSNPRIGAHKFYEKLDYVLDSKIFIKYLKLH